MLNDVRSVGRTVITIAGELPEAQARSFFTTKAEEPTPLVSMRYAYDKDNDTTTIKIIPGRIYSVQVDPIATERTGCMVSHERKILIPGALPKSFDIVDKVWMPIKKSAKRRSDNLRWVVMYPPRYSKDGETNAIFTELTFIIESCDEKSHTPRGCKEKDVPNTLDRAAEMVAESLREIIEGKEGNSLSVTHFINEAVSRFLENAE